MPPDEMHEQMTNEGRALITDREREILSGEADVNQNYKYKTQSVVRNRIKKRLGDDIDFLHEYFPEAHELALEAVCDE